MITMCLLQEVRARSPAKQQDGCVVANRVEWRRVAEHEIELTLRTWACLYSNIKEKEETYYEQVNMDESRHPRICIVFLQPRELWCDAPLRWTEAPEFAEGIFYEKVQRLSDLKHSQARVLRDTYAQLHSEEHYVSEYAKHLKLKRRRVVDAELRNCAEEMIKYVYDEHTISGWGTNTADEKSTQLFHVMTNLIVNSMRNDVK